MASPEYDASEQFTELVRIAARLRGEGGCAWDREQTHASLKACLLEEAYEVVDAIDSADLEKLREELGDLMMQIVMTAQIASEAGHFTIGESLAAINAKLVRRHPHVFGPDAERREVKSPDEVIRQWESIKSDDNDYRTIAEKMQQIPAALPALIRAAKVQKTAARVGFDWGHARDAVVKVVEESREVESVIHTNSQTLAEELGDLLFAVVNVARLSKIDAEDALRQATRKFEARFAEVERRAMQEGHCLSEMSLKDLDAIWDEVKKDEK